MKFNVIFRMWLKPSLYSFPGESGDTTTIGTDVHFDFGDELVTAKGPDVNISYSRDQVKYFMASWI